MRVCWVLALLCGCTADNPGMGTDDGGVDLSVDNPGGDDLAVAPGDLAGVTGDLAVGPDLFVPQDLSGFDLTGVFLCGSSLCASGQSCCVVAMNNMFVGSCVTGGCGDAGVPVSCSQPADCVGGPCCMTLKSGSPTDVTCTTPASSCVPNFSLATQSGPTRLCKSDSDCTAGGITTNDPTCCTYVKYGVHLCLNKLTASLSSGAVTCP